MSTTATASLNDDDGSGGPMVLHPDTTSRPVSIPTTTAVVDGENEASNMAYDNDDHYAELKENHDIFVTLNNIILSLIIVQRYEYVMTLAMRK